MRELSQIHRLMGGGGVKQQNVNHLFLWSLWLRPSLALLSPGWGACYWRHCIWRERLSLHHLICFAAEWPKTWFTTGVLGILLIFLGRLHSKQAKLSRTPWRPFFVLLGKFQPEGSAPHSVHFWGLLGVCIAAFLPHITFPMFHITFPMFGKEVCKQGHYPRDHPCH